jgi:hypothetical protein
MLTLDKLKPGMTLYDCHRHKLGNTTMTAMGVWHVRVVEVHETYAMLSWNGNKARPYSGAEVSRKFRLQPPEWVNGKCYFCYVEKGSAHANDCKHPRAKPKKSKISPPCPPTAPVSSSST